MFRIRVLLPVAALALALGLGIAAWASYTVSASTPMMDPRTATAGYTYTHNVGCATAWNGAETLVLWSDYRLDGVKTGSDIFGTRIDSNNAVLDVPNTLISRPQTPGLQSRPAVAYGGGVWLAVWNDERAGNIDIYATRVSSAGLPVDDGGIPIAINAQNDQLPSVAFDGTRFVVAYQRVLPDGGSDIEAAAVQPDGTVSFTGVTVSNASGSQSKPSIACRNNGACVIVWEDTRADTGDIYGSGFSGSAPDEPAGFVVSQNVQKQGNPSISFDGTSFVAAWDDMRSGSSAVYAARINTSRVVKDPAGIVMSSGTAVKSEVAIACRTAQCLVSWWEPASGRNIFGARLNTATGTRLDVPSIAYTIGTRFLDDPCPSARGADYVLSYFDNSLPGNDNNNVLIVDSATGRVVWTVMPSSSWAPINYSNVVSDQIDTYVAWTQSEGFGYIIAGRRVDALGQPTGSLLTLDLTGSTAVGGTSSMPAMVLNGSGTALVAWTRWAVYEGVPNIVTRRIVNGTLPETRGTRLTSGTASAKAPTVAWDGTGFIVLWDEVVSARRAIRASRVTVNGLNLDDGGVTLYASGSANQEYPKVACSGQTCFVVWHDRRVGGPAGGAALMSAFVDSSAPTISTILQIDQPVDFEWTSLAPGTNGFLVAWSRTAVPTIM